MSCLKCCLCLSCSVVAISSHFDDFKSLSFSPRRNGLKSPPQSKKDTSNTSGMSQFLYFIIYSEDGEIRNSHTKSYKLLHAIHQQHSFIVLASCDDSRLGAPYLVRYPKVLIQGAFVKQMSNIYLFSNTTLIIKINN